MNRFITALFIGSLLIISSCNESYEKVVIDDLVDKEGVSELRMVFKPGLIIGNDTVRKTFQPSYVVTLKGTLLVFCQGRLYSGGDNDPKVILMNRSPDLGKTWKGVEILSSPMNFFAISPYTAILKGNERISFITCVGLKVTKKYYNHDLKKVKDKTGIDIDEVGEDKAAVLCRYYSEDDGLTWNKEFLSGNNTPLYQIYEGITPVFMNTIGQVHKIPEGKYSGRLIIAAPLYTAADGDTITDNFRNHMCSGSGVIYSDDQGETWSMDGMINDYIGNEASAVSVDKGESLFMIRRSNNPDNYVGYQASSVIQPGINVRIAHKSLDGGKTWSDPFLIKVSDIMCHGTLAKVNDRLYFSIPAGFKNRCQVKSQWDDDRIRGAIYYSDDDGKSWDHKIIENDYFSYSTIGKLTDNYLITFFSRGGHGRYGIGYRVFTDRWLVDK